MNEYILRYGWIQQRQRSRNPLWPYTASATRSCPSRHDHLRWTEGSPSLIDIQSAFKRSADRSVEGRRWADFLYWPWTATTAPLNAETHITYLLVAYLTMLPMPQSTQRVITAWRSKQWIRKELEGNALGVFHSPSNFLRTAVEKNETLGFPVSGQRSKLGTFEIRSRHDTRCEQFTSTGSQETPVNFLLIYVHPKPGDSG